MTCISNCLLAVLRKVCALEPCCLLANFCAVFFPVLPPSLVQGQVREKNILVGKDSTDQFIVTVPGEGPSQGCHGLYLLPCSRALPGSTNFVGPSSSVGDKFNRNIRSLYLYSGALCYVAKISVEIKC